MGLIFTCPHCGLTNALFLSHHAVCTAIQNMHVVTYSDAVAEFDRLEKLLRDERAENEKLKEAIERFDALEALATLHTENEELRSSLKVICTWGHMDIRQPEFTPRLVAEDVVALCDKALGNG